MPIRTSLIVTAALVSVIAATFALGCARAQEEEPVTTPTGTPSPPAETTPTTGGGLTVGTTEGPYYVTGTSELEDGNLNYTQLAGDPIRVSGYVYGGSDDSSPLEGAKVELWHADDGGSYHPNANGDASQYGQDELALRGYVVTDERGYYEFTSIYPGFYPGRTRHIHAKASAEGFGAIVTQMIVAPKSGDNVTPETDMIARSLPDASFVDFAEKDGVQVGRFDFHLGGD